MAAATNGDGPMLCSVHSAGAIRQLPCEFVMEQLAATGARAAFL